MGPTLNTAAGMDAYTLADRKTWIQTRDLLITNLKTVSWAAVTAGVGGAYE
jgi:ABC-type tungstate transport system permease subunit